MLSNVLSLCMSQRVRLSSSGDSVSLAPFWEVLLSPEESGKLLRGFGGGVECQFPKKNVTWACWIEREGHFLGIGQSLGLPFSPTSSPRHPRNKSGFQAAGESEGGQHA